MISNTTLHQKHTTMESSVSTSKSSKTWFVFCIGLLLCSCHNVQAEFKLPNGIKFSALLVFGDSIVDPGNNNDVQTPSRANYPPYGRDFIGGVPTGRFSDGMVPSDFIGKNSMYTNMG